MMQKRTLYSLLLISFLVVFAASVSFANEVIIESKTDLPRCAAQSVDITANVSADAISAFEGVFEVTTASGCGFVSGISVVWDLPDGTLSTRIVDLSQADGVAPDTIRIAALRVDDGDGALAQGDGIAMAHIDFTTVDCCAGAVGFDNAIFVYPNPTSPITTQFVDAATATVLPVAVTPGSITITNDAPVIAGIANASLPWGTAYIGSASATDADVANGCEALTFSKVSGPAALNVNGDGSISWNTTGADVGNHVVEVKVVDLCQAESSTSFNICVTNIAPTIVCPDDQLVFYGDLMEAQAVGDDEDGGPYAMVYSLVSFSGPGAPVVDPGSGAISWQTENTANYTGIFEMCVSVTDSANTDACAPRNADTCCFAIEVRSMALTIEKVHGPDGNGVIQGQPVTVSIDMLGADFHNWAIGGFDLLIQYDVTAMSFIDVDEGDFFTGCGWEYFTYRQGASGNCPGGCPDGLIRIVGMAELNNGAYHPDCFSSDETQLALLTFLVSADQTLECMLAPIRWYWVDCGDNTMSSVSGDTLLMSRDVYDYYGIDGVDTYVLLEQDAYLPGWFGAPSPECDVSDKGHPIRHIDFYNGGIDIICGDSIDATGDVNCNGVEYEIADAVMFTNSFISGLAAFVDHVDCSVAASDVNEDGITLSVADLVYLIRVVIGDALPYAKEVAIEGSYTHDAGTFAVTDAEVAAVALVVSGNVHPQLLVDGMDVNYEFDGVNTRIIVTPELVMDQPMNTVTGNILGDINGDIISIDAADYDGTVLALKNIPVHYSLSQNYPNPFNPTTTIAMDIPRAGAFELTIYNIRGQVVETYVGYADAPNTFKYEFDAQDLASGVYLYRLTAADFSSVKKMVLLK